MNGRIEIRITFTADNKRRWDIDNRVKALQDCLSMAGVIRDDSQVDSLHVERCYGKEKGTHMTVQEMTSTYRNVQKAFVS